MDTKYLQLIWSSKSLGLHSNACYSISDTNLILCDNLTIAGHHSPWWAFYLLKEQLGIFTHAESCTGGLLLGWIAVFIICVCLFVCRITRQRLDGFPRNLLEGCKMGQGRARNIFFHCEIVDFSKNYVLIVMKQFRHIQGAGINKNLVRIPQKIWIYSGFKYSFAGYWVFSATVVSKGRKPVTTNNV